MFVWQTINQILKEVLSLGVASGVHTSALLCIKEELRALRAETLEGLRRIESALIPPAAARIVFTTTAGGVTTEVEHMQMKIDAKAVVSLKIVDKFGNAAQVDGAPSWSLTDENLGSLTVAEGGMSAEFVPAGKVGVLKVQASADADLGEGVKTILGELEIDLLPGEAVAVELSGEVQSA